MPAIIKKAAGKQLEKVLQDVLNTEPNEWKYFFEPHRIKEVLEKLANQIKINNFFTKDYSINTFLDFLKAYVKERLNSEELKTINSDILREFNQVCMTLQARIINHTTGLDESQQGIISNYLTFLRQLMESNHRSVFAKSEIKLISADIQAIAGMLTINSASINDDLIGKYFSLLRLSFDVPELLAKYAAGLNILPLAKVCFLNKAIDIHVVSTKSFKVLGELGQLLDYYKKDPRFNITDQFLAKATDNIIQQAIDLQKFFFANLDRRNDIKKSLLQYYLYVYFFKPFYKEYPEKLDALKSDRYLASYIKFDYVALPKSIDCRDYLSSDNKVIIEYNNLNADIPEIACEAITCSSKSYEQWQRSLGFHPTTKSRYIFRVGDSYENYSFTYAYGESPKAGGFYLAGEIKNNTVNGLAYSYFGDKHQFIDVTRHEEVHHKNFRLQLEAQKSNADITSLTNRNFNEGLAVLFAGGACAPGYRSQDFSNTTEPSLDTLLDNEYIGYSTSWLYNNYFIQEYPSFYQDLLRLGKNDFKEKWIPILNQDKDHFINWLPYLKQTCQGAPKELSIKNCPSIFLKDYLPNSVTNVVSTTSRLQRNSKTMPGLLTTKNLNADEMETQLILAIYNNDIAGFEELLQAGANPNSRDNYNGNTPLHFLYFYVNCDARYLKLLLQHGAKITANKEGFLPYAMAEKRCNATQLETIRSVFDKLAPAKLEETGLIPYQQKKLTFTISIPIFAFVSGVIAGGWKEVTKRNGGQYPCLPNIIFYGLEPASLAMGSAAMNSLLVGSATFIGLEDAWLSFANYLGMNYLGLMLAQLGEKATKKIQNKLLNILMPILLYTFFINPSLLITLMSEGFRTESLQAVMMPLFSILSSGILFKAGEYGSQKIIGKFFPVDTVDSASSSGDYFLRYSLDGTPKRISADQKTLQNVKEKLKLLTIKIKKDINNQVYKLNFEENLEAATENISTLLEEISKEEQNIDREVYKNVFKNFEESLVNMQQNLNKLVSGKPKIQLIWVDITTILTSLRSIRPLPQITPDLVANHAMCGTIQEEQQIPLVTSFTGGNQKNKNRFSMLKTISTMFKPSEFPEPPTEQELREMERDMNNKCYPT